MENSTESLRAEARPPLPPRPSELSLMQTRPTTGHGSRGLTRPDLMAGATTMVSMTDVNSYNRPDGSKELRTALSRVSSSPSIRASTSKGTIEFGEDTSSIRSYAPFARQVQEAGSIFDGELREEQGLSSSASEGGLFGRDSDDFDDVGDVDFGKEFEDIDDDTVGEDVAHSVWKAKRKHFIILSAAGKPIYTRHGSDAVISNYVGIVQTIISSFADSADQLRSFQADGVRFVILSQTNLFLVGITSLPESEAQVRLQLDALYMQILSTLTLPTLTHIFSVRPSSDLRRPLEGTEVLLSSLADSFTRGSPSTLLSALECLKIRKSHRQVINSTMIKARVDDLLYGLVVAGGRLVSVIRPKKHSLHPSDLQLIFNMLFEAEGIKAGGGDSWVPICLPGFNKTGYLYMYVSFMDMGGDQVRELDANERIAKEDSVAIILLSANKEGFDDLHSMKNYLVHEFRRNRSMHIIHAAVQAGRPAPTDIIAGTVLRHFLYKSKGNVQFFMPSYSPNFETLKQRRRLLSLYHKLHASVHAKHAAVKVVHSISTSATALAWVTPMFELYCVAGPSASRNALAQSANKVVQWVQREEERIFIIGGAVF
ncbi:Vacuolar fusion protein mon1 [Elasticomyces elasticus]|uniref:Vacuolar fusion protein MON1 n=1 Tax=Exophiala sideris TaxID=1016849 RepID=A0ABR0JIZ8_9EURO|nr:Vacuolar fusion protein mon1 [Elasticomyces elasticus]KAK5030303.1 Vacuolar fusion protein mon1 [Exophiala sideris]KAK5035042.1 Vacuolar fusion protein mon1 [Exophiala sideris]KAK5065965.1 Vacuolar fusion protein mon1 [Exophiala sideris]KAK5178368.1 Vacuolar fusion protein mon1 [Eurotiomycetes sp. CCFEE 6388]